MCEGTREDGTEIAPNDPYWDDLQGAARAAKDTPKVWLDQQRIYGDLGHNAVFSATFARWLSMIWADGATAAMQHYIDT